MNWLKRWRPVEDWRQAARWLSIQAMALELAWLSVYGSFQEAIENMIGHRGALIVGGVIAFLAIVGRMTKQREPTATPEIPATEKLSE